MSPQTRSHLRSLAGLFALAVLSSNVRPISAEELPPDVAPFDALYEIRDAVTSCSDALLTTMERARAKDDTFWTSLATARASATLAFSLSRGADWPRALNPTRRRIERRIVRTGNQLSMIEVLGGKNAARRAQLAARQSVPRIESASSLLAGLLAMPEDPPAAVPPLPPLPAPVPAPPGTIPTLIGGDGFTSAVPQPEVVGAGAGADAKAIARWDVVPYQTVATKIPVGVVAFHISGIEAVDFCVNGGEWARVTEMTQNPLTLVWEYSAWVDPATLTDGLAEVRAIVRPKKGLARVLSGPYDENAAAKGRGEHSLFLNVNAQGTLPSRSLWVDAIGGDDTTGDGTQAHPFKNLGRAYEVASANNAEVGGLTMWLKPGDYAWPASWNGFKENSQYVTVAGAPGQPRTAARITFSDPNHNRGFDARRVCIRNLTVYSCLLGNETKGGMIWTDGCEFEGKGLGDYPWFAPDPVWGLGIWMTRPIIHNLGNATAEYRFMRDYEIYDVGEDAIRDLSGFAINGYIHDMRYGKPDVHADVMQFFNGFGANGQFENVAVYGLKTRRIGAPGQGIQGLFIRNYIAVPTHRDLAFVNCDMEFAGNSQILHSVSHLLIWHCTFTPNPTSTGGGSLLMADDPPDSPQTVVHNFSLRNSVLAYFSNSCKTEPVISTPAGGETWADGNHVVQGPLVGTNVTGGGVLSDVLADPATGNHVPVPASPIVGRLASLLISGDIDGRQRTTPDTVGATVRPAE